MNNDSLKTCLVILLLNWMEGAVPHMFNYPALVNNPRNMTGIGTTRGIKETKTQCCTYDVFECRGILESKL